ncbi:MAG: hypothetical protein ABIX01_02595 [Chitinophagaceae bacterium]
MNRRHFISTAALTGTAIALLDSLSAIGEINERASNHLLIEKLLREWCDGMLAAQINKPEDAKLHGALQCPACGFIHGRCIEAVYPFLYVAQLSGDDKYLDAGIRVFEWEKNVSANDGSWTVMPDPSSWKGITVFGVIALAETLKYHGSIIPVNVKERWIIRLTQAAEYVFKEFNLTFTNINYGFTAVYALYLTGHVLHKSEYIARSRELAVEVKKWFTVPNKLIFGEGKPSRKKSDKGLYPIDLGYNVEETLNGVVMYALEENDEALLALLKQSLEGHLEFMLPDGAWDNSWGTRQFKWTYWGSRTTDGCQPAYTLMAHLNPAFGTAAYQNFLLLNQCTSAGLIHGGLHYVSHGIQPCIHHTFAHAKSLATLLNKNKNLHLLNRRTPLPRSASYGIRVMPEVATYLIATGPWRGTVTAYDAVYKEHVQQATGGALALLWHKKTGPLFTASMANYKMVEVYNQQPDPDGEDFALTPHLETIIAGKRYSNLFDLKAEMSYKKNATGIEVIADLHLVDEDRNMPAQGALNYQLHYLFEADKVTIKAIKQNNVATYADIDLVLPVVSSGEETVTQPNDKTIQIKKKKGTVVLTSNVPLQIKITKKSRVFNLVPGMEAVPVIIRWDQFQKKEIHCTIEIM